MVFLALPLLAGNRALWYFSGLVSGGLLIEKQQSRKFLTSDKAKVKTICKELLPYHIHVDCSLEKSPQSIFTIGCLSQATGCLPGVSLETRLR